MVIPNCLIFDVASIVDVWDVKDKDIREGEGNAGGDEQEILQEFTFGKCRRY